MCVLCRIWQHFFAKLWYLSTKLQKVTLQSIFTVTPLPWEFIISQQTPVLPSKLYTHLIITMVSATSPPNLELNKTCGAAGRTLWCRAGPGPVTSRRCDYSSATRGESQHRDNWFNSLTSVRDCYREETWTCPYWFLQLSFNFPSSFSLFLLSVVISLPPFSILFALFLNSPSGSCLVVCIFSPSSFLCRNYLHLASDPFHSSLFSRPPCHWVIGSRRFEGT